MNTFATTLLGFTDSILHSTAAQLNDWAEAHPAESDLLIACFKALNDGIVKQKPEVTQMPEPKSKKQEAKAKQQADGEKKERIPQKVIDRFLAFCSANGYGWFVRKYYNQSVPQSTYNAMFGFLGAHMDDDDEAFGKAAIEFFNKKKSNKHKAKAVKRKEQQVEEVKPIAE